MFTEFLQSDRAPLRWLKRPFQVYRYARTFSDWPSVLRNRWRGGAPADVVTFHLRNGRSITVFSSIDRALIGQIFIVQPYHACRRVANAKLIWDVGANVGAFVIWASQYWPDAEYYSFEPCEQTFHLLQTNKTNNPSLRWSIYGYGISDTNEKVVAYAPAQAPTLTSAFRTSGKRTELPLRNINEVWQEKGCPRIDILKIDCEGYEHTILEGVSTELLRHIRFIIMEIDPVPGKDQRAIKRKLEANNFTVSWSDMTVATVWAENKSSLNPA